MNSVHLQRFSHDGRDSPESITLMHEMDIVREICSISSSIRKKHNIRARVPLSQIRIIGENIGFISQYQQIILDETNTKELFLDYDFRESTDLKLQINFSKCGKKLGSKMKDVIFAQKTGAWQRLANGSIIIADQIITADDYDLILAPKVEQGDCEAFQTDFLVQLDVTITPDLEMEGIARDFIRIIQNARKINKLDLSDKICIMYGNASKRISACLSKFTQYINNQTLSESLTNGTSAIMEEVDLDGEKILYSIQRI